jgi:hypothetical protein
LTFANGGKIRPQKHPKTVANATGAESTFAARRNPPRDTQPTARNVTRKLVGFARPSTGKIEADESLN